MFRHHILCSFIVILFYRVEYQSRSTASGSSFKHLLAELPPRVHSVYYRDDIGNISSSRLRLSNKKVIFILCYMPHKRITWILEQTRMMNYILNHLIYGQASLDLSNSLWHHIHYCPFVTYECWPWYFAWSKITSYSVELSIIMFFSVYQILGCSQQSLPPSFTPQFYKTELPQLIWYTSYLWIHKLAFHVLLRYSVLYLVSPL